YCRERRGEIKMETWSWVTGFLALRLEQFGTALAHAPVVLVVAALVFPILLAALSRQIIAFLSALQLVAAVFAIDASTSPAAVLVAIESYVAAILIGCLALQASYRNRKFRTELETLRD